MLVNNKVHHLKILETKFKQTKNFAMLFENLDDNWKNEIRLSTKEAALFLGISPNALRIKVHRGQVNAEKLDKKLRFKFSSLVTLFKKMEV